MVTSGKLAIPLAIRHQPRLNHSKNEMAVVTRNTDYRTASSRDRCARKMQRLCR